MGCGGCGSATANGKPAGCQSNGNCGTSGCNKLNVFNWLAEIPLADLGKPYPIVEISFKNGSRKDFFRNHTHHIFEKGTFVTVEGSSGFDVGQVSLTGELVKLQMKKHGVSDNPEIKRILRPSGERDLELYSVAKQREKEILVRSRAIAKTQNLDMKIAEVEVQADGKKIAFFYTADARVDFRELIKIYASEFKAKVEMRQIGARQESAKIGGIGSCGRELCCSTWLTDFKTVNTTAARYQNLSINQTKLSGQCGRLKCCLNYELDTYMDALKEFPENADHLELAAGKAYLQKKDIFRNLMWYSFAGSNKQYPLTIERVQHILAMNAEGKKPEELEAVEIQVKAKGPEKIVDMGFVNDVGQITLNSLSRSGKRKKQQGKPGRSQQPQGQSAAGKTNRPAHKPRNAKPEAGTGENKSRNAAQGPGKKPAHKKRPNRPPQPPKEQGK